MSTLLAALLSFMSIEVNWDNFVTEPFEQQRNFIRAALDPKIKMAAAISGLQGGKTLSGADAVWNRLYGPNPLMLPEQIRHMSMEVWVISKSYALVDVALATLRARAPADIWIPEGVCKKVGLKRYDPRTHWLYPNVEGLPPICIRARTAGDPEAFRATPALGLAWCDEVAHWKELAWYNLQGRAIVTGAEFLVTTTPAGRNWLYRDVYLPGVNGLDPTISVHTWTSADNPYASKRYIAKLRTKFGPDYAAQELDGLFTASVGYVYDFDRTVHMSKKVPSDDPDDYKERVVGIDPGYGDPYAAVLCLKDWNDHWWIADELYLPTKATVEEATPKLKQWHARWKVKKMYVDKRRPTDYVLLRRKGLPAVANVDIFGENNRRTVMPMIRMVQRVMREGRFHVAPHCEWTAEEFEHYSFKTNDEKNAGENPIDHHNHLMDSARYAICAVEALPEDLRPRYRTANNRNPHPLGGPRSRPGEPAYKFATAQEYRKAQNDKIEKKEQKKRRDERRRMRV